MTDDNLEGKRGEEVKKKGCGFWALVVGGVLVFLFIIGTIFGPNEEEQAKMEAEAAAQAEKDNAEEAKKQAAGAKAKRDGAVKTTASELFNSYQNNEAAAQQTYGGKLLEVSGTIDGVDLDFADNPIVKLRTPNQFMSASVYLTEAHQSAATGYSKGSKVTFLCEEVSEVMSMPQLKECVPVE